MKKNIEKLFQLSQKKNRNIIGLMSGTSLDGLDIAFCNIEGNGLNTKLKLLAFETIEYAESTKQKIRQVFAKETIDFQYLTILNEWLGNFHGELINQFLIKHQIDNSNVDLIASHGQTVFHSPKILHQLEEYPNATLQIADGDHIAVKTGIITISDFRQKHLAAGGEGAPLAVYGDYLLFSVADKNRIMLNMGGISNFTFLGKSFNAFDVFVTDVGPGNTLIDAFTRHYFPSKAFDKDSEIALEGTVNEALLLALFDDPFFNIPPPKTTGPELFSKNYVINAQAKSNTSDISAFDLMATLTLFSAKCIANSIQKIIKPNEQYDIYLSGGGMHNPLLVSHLKNLLPNFNFKKTDELGIDGNAKEAILFAILANETVAGDAINFGPQFSVPAVSFGKISLPE